MKVGTGDFKLLFITLLYSLLTLITSTSPF
jgi:hypothetical protein